MKPKVLIIRFSSLGDLIHSSAAIAPYIDAGFEVHFLTKKHFAPVLSQYPGLNLYEYDSGNEPQSREDFFQWFEGQNFQLVLDLHDSWRSWKWRSRMKRKCPVIVAKKQRLLESAILWFRMKKSFSLGRGGRAKRYQRLALDSLARFKLFPKTPKELTKLYLSSKELAAVEKFLPPSEFVILLPGSAWSGKEWPFFPELASVLAKKVPVLVLGGEKDIVCDLVASEARKWNSHSVSLRGKTTIRESMALLSKAKWIIGNDTGLIHAAEALGKDVAVIEGPTHESLGFSPYRKNSILLGLNLFCRPCSKSGKICFRLGTRKCLKGLSVQKVMQGLVGRGYPC